MIKFDPKTDDDNPPLDAALFGWDEAIAAGPSAAGSA